ncbi:hypothetical protein FRACYDRAFT_245637 [Fragilariopsis cylindrus CCMP1102]|uniref:DUF6824 domain-containing protein n=1 Tax=Fragilariopsis cylindrus CCMP1102 TaxID=635003 RepID=A0A1E7EZN6_9STRA|nr:hypothetical protein FRACYDRAFT_245637 [Fragilariopsis cylindrus CCMP1102]|eukprot:OEU11327.1 hypothetical protein FRACYDRAFT_245637 [Fragilariopsis cylindrus CCMP1102]
MPKKKNNNEDIILLPSTFIPSSFDVICAQGKEAKNHSGNIHYRTLITDALDQYSKATSKIEKSQIVTDIVDTVTTESNAAGDDSEGIIGGGSGGFIKKDRSTGRYYNVGEYFAREKIGQNLRDSLSNKYKSSTKAKRNRRLAASTDLNIRVERLIQSNKFIQNKRDMLQSKCTSNNSVDSGQGQGQVATPEYFMNQLFIQTNLEILEAFKTDETLVQKFNDAEKNVTAGTTKKKKKNDNSSNSEIDISQLKENPEKVLKKIERRRSSMISIGLFSGRELRRFRRASVVESSSSSSSSGIIQDITQI